MIVSILFASVCLSLVASCGDDCPDISGQWRISSHCEPAYVGQTFSVTQDACEVEFSAPFSDWSGNVTSQNDVTVSGPAGDETMMCTGTASSSSMTVNCEPGGCGVSFTKL